MYNRFPTISIPGIKDQCFSCYDQIAAEVMNAVHERNVKVIIIECYPGIRYNELYNRLIKRLSPDLIISSEEYALSKEHIESLIQPFLTDDRVFGTMSYTQLTDYFDKEKVDRIRSQLANYSHNLTVIYGVGASIIANEGLLIYADLCRWEIQQRYRNENLPNWLSENAEEDILRKYKRGYFWEWRIADRHKKQLFHHMDYYLDTNKKDNPRMITGEAFLNAMGIIARRPFRTMPYFDPGVWGGQWMKKVCGLDENAPNYAWSFDGVPEENSLLLDFEGIIVQTPCSNLVYLHPEDLLGEKVYARFGSEFPIRFDLLDTMNGQNLSLQVHPRTSYIMDRFGMHYTQDESYYLLDSKENACVYLGLKTNTNPEEMVNDLIQAQQGLKTFPVEKYINQFNARKHDHFLIPAGTIHCSGMNTMVLEISATPYIFTFKLWDWDRIGLDGLPRPTHINFGKENIEWCRDTQWVKDNIVNRVDIVSQGDGWKEERTGLHELEFIETRRHWFSKKVHHETCGSVNVLNLVEGSQAIVESPSGLFAPFIVNYVETFIIPASVKEYTIAPFGDSVGSTIATIKAYVRTI